MIRGFGVGVPSNPSESEYWTDVPRRLASLSPGLLVRLRRPSVAPSAWSRGGDGRELRPRRWHAGGLPRGVGGCTGARSPRLPPLTLFGMRLGELACIRNNIKDGTPGGGHIPSDSGAVSLKCHPERASPRVGRRISTETEARCSRGTTSLVRDRDRERDLDRTVPALSPPTQVDKVWCGLPARRDFSGTDSDADSDAGSHPCIPQYLVAQYAPRLRR
jgi:hypothetical protein